MTFCAPLRAGSCWRPHLEDPPRHAKKPPKERFPSLHEPSGEFASLQQVLQDKQSCHFVKEELCTLATTQWGTRGAVVPGELPRFFPNRTVGFKTSERFCCPEGLKKWQTHTRRAAQSFAGGKIPAAVTTSSCPSKPLVMEKAPQPQERPAKKEGQKQLK